MPEWQNDQVEAKPKDGAYPSKQWATVRTHFLAMRTQPQMCPLGSLCREHCHGHLPGRLVRPPRILLFIRAAGRRPQSTREQERQRVIHQQTQLHAWIFAVKCKLLFLPWAKPVKFVFHCYTTNSLTLFSTQKRDLTSALTRLPRFGNIKWHSVKSHIYHSLQTLYHRKARHRFHCSQRLYSLSNDCLYWCRNSGGRAIVKYHLGNDGIWRMFTFFFF